MYKRADEKRLIKFFQNHTVGEVKNRQSGASRGTPGDAKCIKEILGGKMEVRGGDKI